jgi:hypothetical protein
MNILIGSRAMNYWNPSVPIRDDSDWDVISCSPIEGVEFHDRFLLNNDDLFRYCTDDKLQFNGKTFHVLSMKGLSLVKRSHLHRDLSFDKHITHYWKYLQYQSKFWNESDLAFLAQRTQMTLETFPQVKPNLNQLVDSFFNDAVYKRYNHDYLHELFAYEGRPMYTKLQRNPELAKCEQDLWDNLTHKQKVQCVAEEAQVIATERFLVPKDWNYPTKAAYMKALQKVCTTLTSGWFRDFALDNYPSAVELFSKNKFNEVKNKLLSEVQ